MLIFIHKWPKARLAATKIEEHVLAGSRKPAITLLDLLMKQNRLSSMTVHFHWRSSMAQCYE